MSQNGFGNYIMPTKNTRIISQWVQERSGDKYEAMLNATAFVGKYVLYAEDKEIWGEDEYFATPDETLTIGDRHGDCDDKAGLLAAILLGMDTKYRPDEVRVAIGKQFWGFPDPLKLFGYHAWTEARIGDKWYVLEAVTGAVYNAPYPMYAPIAYIYPNKFMFAQPAHLVETFTIAPFLGVPFLPFI